MGAYCDGRERLGAKRRAIPGLPDACDAAPDAPDDTMVELPKKRIRKVADLQPLTVRLTPAARIAIRDIAAEHHISQAELIRIALAGSLERYLGSIRIIDPEQGAEIRQNIIDLINLTGKVEMELNRIGVNFNQAVRLMRQTGNVDNVSFPKNEIYKILDIYDQATRQVGDLLCRILG